MKFITAISFITVSVILTGCSSMKVSCELNRPFDYSSVKTFQWIDAPEEVLKEDNIYTNENIQKALNNELSAKGWQQVLETPVADIQAAYYIKLEEHTEYSGPAGEPESELSGGFVYSSRDGKWNYREQEPDLNAYTVETGILHLLLYDAETGNGIWHGTLETGIDRSKPLEKQREMFRKISRKLTAQIPAGAN